MQGEQNTVEPTPLDRCDDRITEPVERHALNFATRPRCRAKDMFNLPAIVSGGIKEAGQLGARLAACGDGLFSDQNISIFK